MVKLQETYTLANGIKIPQLGLETWFIRDEDSVQAVKDAVATAFATHFLV